MSALPTILRRYRARLSRTSPGRVFYLLLPLAVLALLVGGFPNWSETGRPVARFARGGYSAEYVRLTPEEYVSALAKVRTAWQLERGGPESVELDPADLAFQLAAQAAGATFLERPPMPPMKLSSRLQDVGTALSLQPPTLAAPAPEELRAQGSMPADQQLFTRTQLIEVERQIKEGTMQ